MNSIGSVARLTDSPVEAKNHLAADPIARPPLIGETAARGSSGAGFAASSLNDKNPDFHEARLERTGCLPSFLPYGGEPLIESSMKRRKPPLLLGLSMLESRAVSLCETSAEFPPLLVITLDRPTKGIAVLNTSEELAQFFGAFSFL